MFKVGREDKADVARIAAHAGAAPPFDDPRKATEFGANLDVLWNDVLIWGRYSPFVAFGPSRRESGIDAFSYNERRFLFGLRRNL